MELLRKLLPSKKFAGIDNSELLRAMHEVALADTPENRNRLYRIMLDCWFLIPVAEMPEMQSIPAPDANVSLSMTATKDKQGLTVTPVFTDEQALRNWDPNTPYLRIKSRALFQMVRQSPIAQVVINPFDPIRKMIRPGGRVARYEFDTLADGYIPRGRPDVGGVTYNLVNEKAVATTKADLRADITGAVISSAQQMSEIAALYAAQITPPSATPRNIIAVEFAAPYKLEHQQRCIQQLGQAARNALQQGESLDFAAASSSLGNSIKLHGTQIFARPAEQ